MDKNKLEDIISKEAEEVDSLQLLRQKYNLGDMTPEEMVEAFVFPNELSAEEMAAANAELRIIRFQRLANMTEQEKLKWNLFGLNRRIEASLQTKKFSEEHSFAFHFKDYLKMAGKTEKELAHEINLPAALVHNLLNGKTDPELRLLYRLEKHSGGNIPALLWWKLLAKKVEHSIQFDVLTRNRETANVKTKYVELGVLNKETMLV